MSAAIQSVVVPPKEHSIDPRPVEFAFSEQTPRFWFDNDIFKTHYYNAFLTTFPPGEQFFVRSVLHFRDQISDPKLQEQINDFASQEGSHSSAHQKHLDILSKQGYSSLERENRLIDRGSKLFNKLAPKAALAATVALEHFTAMLAHQMYEDPATYVTPAHEDFKPMFLWHAAEEIEHKSVAFDVYQQVDGSYGRRVIAMVFATIGMFLMIPFRMFPLLLKDGIAFKWKTWREGIPFLFGKNGKLTKPWRHYIQFYRRDFHPWDVQDFHLIEDFRRIYEEGKLLTNVDDILG